jgi:hypothetical protein
LRDGQNSRGGAGCHNDDVDDGPIVNLKTHHYQWWKHEVEAQTRLKEMAMFVGTHERSLLAWWPGTLFQHQEALANAEIK